ncbi:MAG: twin-arginine translocation signal domain-containing protein, partial [Deltaproteobacteria bacterium]|nr:twin-arginine translocation signal domain-containing protein [Deltaproteobacteria bacterium]
MMFTRRSFLRKTGVAALGLTLANLQFACGPGEKAPSATTPAPAAPAKVAALPPLPEYRSWEDLYRKQWNWDRVVKSSHLRTNCIAACSWNIYVKDGIVLREEQNTIYEAPNNTVPDMNPRGCQ